MRAVEFEVVEHTSQLRDSSSANCRQGETIRADTRNPPPGSVHVLLSFTLTPSVNCYFQFFDKDSSMKPQLVIRNRAPPVGGQRPNTILLTCSPRFNSKTMQILRQIPQTKTGSTNVFNGSLSNVDVDKAVQKPPCDKSSQMASNNRPSDFRRRIHTTSM
jgi:hypothetical protein